MQQASIRRILIVDDNTLVRSFTRTALERVGYHADMDACGRDALERIREGHPYDLLITDINMPEINGFELLENLRDQPHMRKVIYSATAEDSEIRTELTARDLLQDVDAIIGKPCPLAEFLEKIEQVLHRPA